MFPTFLTYLIPKTIIALKKYIKYFHINKKVNPYYKKKKTPCDYCKYKAICGFDTANSNNQYNYINEAEKNAVLEMIKEQVEN